MTRPLLLLFVLIMFVSCWETNNKTYISCCLTDKNGKFAGNIFSLIFIRSDSIFYQDLENLDYIEFLGIKKPNKQTYLSGDDSFVFKNNKIIASNSTNKLLYKSLDKINLKEGIDSSYFLNNTFSINSTFYNDTVRFIDENKSKRRLVNYFDRWFLYNIEGNLILWMNYQHEEVPLIIYEIDSNGFKAKIYALNEIEVEFKKI